jgi:hypothetical protein
MAETATLKLPYPVSGDSPNGPSQIEALAEAAESAILAGDRGKAVIIPGAETRQATSYGLLATPDKVEGLVVPTKGIIRILYHAVVKQAKVGSGGLAAIFIGANQLKADLGGTAPEVTFAEIQKENAYHVLSTGPSGLGCGNFGTWSGDATTGQVFNMANSVEPLGGCVDVFVNAGTYDISVQYKSSFATSEGLVTAKERRLYAWVKEFS